MLSFVQPSGIQSYAERTKRTLCGPTRVKLTRLHLNNWCRPQPSLMLTNLHWSSSCPVQLSIAPTPAQFSSSWQALFWPGASVIFARGRRWLRVPTTRSQRTRSWTVRAINGIESRILPPIVKIVIVSVTRLGRRWLLVPTATASTHWPSPRRCPTNTLPIDINICWWEQEQE